MTATAQDTSAQKLEFDIVVAGGSLGATAAAFSAARSNPDAKVLLTEPTDWLGGQATSQGVSAIDNSWHNPGAKLMRENPELYYAQDFLDFLERIRQAPDSAPGEGYGGEMSSWVTRDAYDPRTGAWVLDEMAAEFPNLTVMKLTVPKDVKTEVSADKWGAGLKIVSLKLVERKPAGDYRPFDKWLSGEIPDWYSTQDSKDYKKVVRIVEPRNKDKGLVVIDGTELADVAVLSGAVYTVGRELETETIGDDGTLPEMDETASMAFVFPFCMTGAEEPSEEKDIQAWFEDFDAYYKKMTEEYYELGKHSWRRVWTYRRLKNVGDPWQFDTVNQGDVSMQNWNPGNDYRFENFYKDKAAAAAEASDWKGGVKPDVLTAGEKHAIGWYFWMKRHKPEDIPFDTRYCHGWDDPLNMMDTKHGLSKFPYIRGTRRIVGLFNFRITDRYFVPSGQDISSYRYYDSVGIGNYAADIRPIIGKDEGISPSVHQPAPFYIPYRALGSVNVRNLLASGKLYAQTYVTNSAYRLHPIEWAAGSAAGTAAALMTRDGKSNYDLLDIETLRELQRMVAENSPIHWEVYDTERIPSYDGDVIVNDLKPVEEGQPIRVEVYHPTAARAVIMLGDKEVGMTSLRANGRLVCMVPSAPAGSTDFKALCYDKDGELIATIPTAASAIESITISPDIEIKDDLDGSETK